MYQHLSPINSFSSQPTVYGFYDPERCQKAINKDKIWQIDMWFNGQVKPILRPMSDLYVQIENGIENEVTYIDDLSQSCDNHIEFGFIQSVIDSGKLLEKPLPYWVFQWFCKNHFDFQYLINSELAIDINTLSVE
jgi:hypothetical protein